MAVKFSNTVRNALMNAYEGAIGATPKLRIFSGAEPATLGAAATGDLLLEIDLPADWMSAANAGVITKLGTWTANAIGTGIAGYYRILQGAVTHEQGTVGMAAGADLILNNTNIAIGQTVVISTFSKTAPGAA